MEITAQFFGVLYAHAAEESTVEHRSFPNINGEGRPSRLMSRDLEEIETFLGRNDIKGRGVFFGVATRKAGCTQGRREDLHEIVAVWVDIDTEALGLEKDAVVDLLRGSFRSPTAITDSGRGIHAYWRLSEAVTVDLEADGGREAGEAIEQVNRQLAHVYAGDTNACDVTRVMRTPGTHNSKEDGWRDCLVLYLDGPEHDFGDLSDWLSWQSPLIDRPAGSEVVPRDGNGNPFETYGKQYGGDMKPPMDVGDALDAMTYQGQGNAGVHQTQLRVSLSLLGKGWAEDDIVALLLEKTAAAVGDAGRFWNWAAEERALRGMIVSGRTKIGDSVRNIQDSKADLEEGAEAPNWADALKRDQHGKIKPTLNNLSWMVEHLTVFEGCFWHDEFRQRHYLSEKTPWRTSAGELRDGDVRNLMIYMAREHHIDFTEDHAKKALEHMCEMHLCNPLIDYLDGLEWDGEARVASWLTRMCGADASDYTAAVGRMFLLSAVARAYNPGCQVDDVMILEGDQGTGKSTGIQNLVPLSDAFMDAHINISDGKAAGELIQGKWLIELSELSAIKSNKDIQRVKGFISQKVDRFRAAYGKYAADHPRQCVFFGTTNDIDYLSDPSGNRRFWPVPTGRIDRDAIAHYRDQIWAEAVLLFKDGAPWHIEDRRLIEKADAIRAGRQEVSSWDEHLERYITHSPARDERNELMPMDTWAPRAEPLTEISFPEFIEKITGADKYRTVGKWERSKATKALQNAGWIQERPRRSDGTRPRIWIFEAAVDPLGGTPLKKGYSTNGGPKKRF